MSQVKPTDAEATILASEYIRNGDKTKAFKVAFPKSKTKGKTQNEKASRLFKTSKVIARIDELKGISKKNSEEEFTMSVSELKKKLSQVIEKGLDDDTSTSKDGTITVKQGNLSAAVSAIKEFNCMDGNHSPIETKDVTNELTPWGSVTSGVDKMKEEDKFDEE